MLKQPLSHPTAFDRLKFALQLINPNVLYWIAKKTRDSTKQAGLQDATPRPRASRTCKNILEIA